MINATEIVALSKEAAPYAVTMRRHFHLDPEPTSKEFKTMDRLCQELEKMEIPYVRIPDGGILATVWKGEEDDPKVLLRADCDALTMEESPERGAGRKEFVSQNPGVAHMCGHDSHMAMLLGAAKVLKELEGRRPKGTVHLLFERGEEGGNCIYYVMKHIQEKQIKIDTCYALHVDPDLPTGTFCVREGASHAGNVNFEIVLTGKGGHGSRPDLSNHPLDCFLSIAGQMKDIKNKYLAPDDVLTYNIGSVQTGSKRNIIPETLEFKGTSRFFSSKAGAIFKARLDEIIRSNAALYRCGTEYRVFSGPSLPVINDRTAAQLERTALAEAFGEDTLKEKPMDLGSESFAVLSAYYPSVIIRLGVRNEEKGITAALHNPHFDLDEEALPYGIASHVCYAVAYLQKRPKFTFEAFQGDADAVLKATNRPVPKRYDRL